MQLRGSGIGLATPKLRRSEGGYWIQSMAPKGMAAHQAPHRERASAQDAVPLDRLAGVL